MFCTFLVWLFLCASGMVNKMTEFTVGRLSPYHKVPQMTHIIMQNGIAIAWTKNGIAAELIESCLNAAGDDND